MARKKIEYANRQRLIQNLEQIDANKNFNLASRIYQQGAYLLLNKVYQS